MNLYIMRHGIAAEPDETTVDSQRALTEKGEKKLEKIVIKLQKLNIRFDLILTSPYIRAYQTAILAAKYLADDGKHVILCNDLVPFGSFENLVNGLNSYEKKDNILIVGHEPYLSQLIGLLAAGDITTGLKLKKGGICHLSISQLIAGKCAIILSLLTPKQFI
ncbi:MAG: phosphohistidine phosphatase SixA [Chloroflexota bacterium]